MTEIQRQQNNIFTMEKAKNSSINDKGGEEKANESL